MAVKAIGRSLVASTAVHLTSARRSRWYAPACLNAGVVDHLDRANRRAVLTEIVQAFWSTR
jgi:hypothetical protein